MIKHNSVLFFLCVFISHSIIAQKIVAWDIHEVLCSKPAKHGWQCTPSAPVFQIVETLHNNGTKQVLFSNISKSSLQKLINRYPDYFKYFDLHHSTASGKGIFFKKPHAKYIKNFLQKNVTDPENIIFFDNSSTNVEAARKQGIDAYIFHNPSQIQEILQQKGLL